MGHASVDSIGDFKNFSVEVDVQKISGADYGTSGIVGRLRLEGFIALSLITGDHRKKKKKGRIHPPTSYHIKGICDHGRAYVNSK